MNIEKEVNEIIGLPESETLEYKAVLPPSKNIAQLICSFANSNGGFIILGVSDNLEINGLSEDFHATSITHKALDLLSPKPIIYYQYIIHKEKKLYAIKIEKSNDIVIFEGKVYKRVGTSSSAATSSKISFKTNGYNEINIINNYLELSKNNATNSKIKLIEHYQSILKIIDDLSQVLFPLGPTEFTDNLEGKILLRILFSSYVDNFETYLSDLLYEIFLANPSTLKSTQKVTIEEVLNCSDIQEFVKYWSKEKLSKLQKGSVKGFISENKQISDLNILDASHQHRIEIILQIRHLYSHRNGIVDEKFLKFYKGNITLNSEHQMPISEFCSTLNYLAQVINLLDLEAMKKYNLANGNI